MAGRRRRLSQVLWRRGGSELPAWFRVRARKPLHTSETVAAGAKRVALLEGVDRRTRPHEYRGKAGKAGSEIETRRGAQLWEPQR